MAGTSGLGSRGFTLIECMVSLVVGSLVVLAVQAAVQTTLDIADFRRERDVALASLRAEAVRATVREWLEGVSPTVPGEGGAPLEGHEGESGGLPADAIAFVTLDRGFLLGGPEERPLRARLAVSLEAGLTLEYAGMDSASAVGVLPLLPEVQGLDVRYLTEESPGGAEWTDAWTGEDLPRAVELRFHAAPGRSLPKELQSPLLLRPGPG